MLTDIFRQIGDELKDYIIQHTGKNKKITVAIGKEKAKNKATVITLELFRFGYESTHKNYVTPGDAGKSSYSFSFFVHVCNGNAENCLTITELISNHFDKKPFVQWKSAEKEFELALSPIELTIDELNHFWIAQQEPHRPVLFYQARISEI